MSARRARWSGMALALVLVVIGLVAAGPARAVSAQTVDPAPTIAGEAPDLPAPDGSGPHLTGRTEPPAAQRIVDSLIWVWLLAVLVLAPVVWIWTGRRSRPDGGEPTPN